MDTVALRMWADLRCAICEQTPDNTRWGEFAANEPTKPMNNLCYECEDTCKRRWPMMHKFEVQTKAKQDDQFRGQVKHMTQVKLGQAAKLFISQEVEATETVGFRVEEELVPMEEQGPRILASSRLTHSRCQTAAHGISTCSPTPRKCQES